MRYVVSLSGGKASAVAAERAITRFGRANVDLFFADTKWEDEDLYRFLADCMARWGGELIRHTDGRTPLQVFEDQHIIPSQRVAPCTYTLKIAPFRRWLKAQPKPMTVLLGLDWRERHRLDAPRKHYGAMEGVSVDFPLSGSRWSSDPMGMWCDPGGSTSRRCMPLASPTTIAAGAVSSKDRVSGCDYARCSLNDSRKCRRGNKPSGRLVGEGRTGRSCATGAVARRRR